MGLTGDAVSEGAVRVVGRAEPSAVGWIGNAGVLLMAITAVGLLISGYPLAGGSSLLATALSLHASRRLVGQVRVATQQKSVLDRQLIQSQKLASIGELSSGIAHEINNPLAIIGQEVEWVRHLLKAERLKELEEISDLAESIGEIARQVERCGEITHKLLDFARKSEPLIQSVDINKLIDDMARLVEKEAVLNNVKILREYFEDLPKIRTDAPLLRQVILNLLNNATYAIQKNGTVTVSTGVSGESSVDISVKDTGCGIPREDLGKIFDPFFTTKPPGKGTGLGLSICHGIIQRLGGAILVESEPGVGTIFTVRLPLRDQKGTS